MNIPDFITQLYCRIDDTLPHYPCHPQAIPSLGEVVAIGVLDAMKNIGRRPF